MLKKKGLYYLFLFLFPCILQAQELNHLRSKKIFLSDTISLDSLSIIPNTLVIKDSAGQIIDSSKYEIDYSKSQLIFQKKNQPSLSSSLISVTYSVFPYNFSKEYKHKDLRFIQKNKLSEKEAIYSFQEKQSASVFEFGGLEKSGSISRGISFGNAQDVTVSSNLNLQLSGKLSDNIEIKAAVTDKNIPIQPEGNTQQIQDFDKVFIQLSTKKTNLIAGDFELTKPNGYFMNFYKKAQGALLSTSQPIEFPSGQKGKLNVSASASISKGKYAKNILIAREGIQGPYRLSGAMNETYIVVLSGTEKIYIDGQLLSRGQENDYVIDYNTAEITFSPKVPITKDKRITAEFQYAEKNYARSMFFAGTEYEQQKFKFRFNFFSEQDLKNQPLMQTLNTKEKTLLADVGDHLDRALYPSIDSINFNNDEVLYKKKDSLGFDSVFIHSTNPDSAYYRLKFSYVGEKKGNYIQIKSIVNGKIFQWVAPKGNVPQGNYEPVVQLIAPQRNRMYTFGADYQLTKKTKLNTEFAISDHDINTFSTKDKGNDVGYAFKLTIENKSSLGKNENKKWTVLTDAQYEWLNNTFSPIERYRNIEFERDWNSKNIINPTEEHLAGMHVLFTNKKIGSMGYQFKTFLKGTVYKGYIHLIHLDLQLKKFFLQSDGSMLTTNSSYGNTEFFRQHTGLTKKFKHISLGIKDETEYNKMLDQPTKNFQSTSFAYNEWQAFISSNDTAVNRYTIYYKERTDQLPKDNSFKEASIGQSVGAELNLVKKINNRLLINSFYRKLMVKDSSISNKPAENSLLGRIEYYAKWFKGIINVNTFYEIGSGVELKKEYSYIEVTRGQGIYTWKDYNNNAIKELNEFEIAAFRDQANYIRVFTPTNQFVKTYSNQFNQLFDLNPGVAWKNKKGFKKLISHFSNKTIYSINRKTNNDHLAFAYNPFSSKTEDTSIVSMNSSFRNTFYFNRGSNRFSVELNVDDNRNKLLLTNGFTSRTLSSKGFRIRWNINKAFMLLLTYNRGHKTDSSDFFSNRNFKINFYETEPQLTFQPDNNYRITLRYKYTNKKNHAEIKNTELAIIQKVGIDFKYNFLSKASVSFRYDMINITYNAAENTSLSYEMLDALKKGMNMTWSISLQKELMNNLQLSFIYDGRKSPGTKTINIGSVQVRAYF